jgi:predicted transcriptional regulator
VLLSSEIHDTLDSFVHAAYMADSTTVTVRLSREAYDRLKALAHSTQRTQSFLAAEAIAAYLETHAWQVHAIEEAVRKADAGGPFVAHEDVVSWARSLRHLADAPPQAEEGATPA